MTKLSIVILRKVEWLDILSEFGRGNITPRYRYEELDNDDDRFKWHTIVHGHNTQTGNLTNTGFLRNNSGEIIAGVDGIPT